MFTKKPIDHSRGVEPSIPTSSIVTSNAQSTPSVVSSEMTVNGNMQSAGEVQIEGTIEGDVRASSIVVGSNAKVRGDITAENIHLRGSVTGTVRARSVILVGGCRVVGDIINQSLEIEKGAHFEGASCHSDDPMATSDKTGGSSDKPVAKPVKVSEVKARNDSTIVP